MNTEKRLIDADAFLSSMIKRFKCVPLIGRNDYDCESLRQMLIEAPTVDAVEVVHGRWEEWWSEEYITYFHKCSVCGYDALTKEETCHDEVLSNYCPNCGAKMDGDGNG